jgi:regulatory protein
MSLEVTSISPKKRRPDVLVVKFSDGVELELKSETVQQFGVYTGVRMDEVARDRVTDADHLARCREAAWRLLSLRPRSRAELARGLRQRKFRAAATDAVVEELARRGYLDDEAFAKIFAEERARRRHGPRLIEQELRARGVDSTNAREAAAGTHTPESQRESARALLEKWNRRTKPEDPQKRRVAAANFLARRGFDSDIVWDAVRDILGAPHED